MSARPGEARALLDGVLAMPSWPEECIDWPYARNEHGYGKANVGGDARLVHQLACEHRHGPRPDGMVARHLCGRGHLGCFNPAHLEWSTRAVNEADKVAHDTHDRGERHALHKLTEEHVRQIRRMYVGRGGPTLQSIADQFDISKSLVFKIVNRKTWGWLSTPQAERP